MSGLEILVAGQDIADKVDWPSLVIRDSGRPMSDNVQFDLLVSQRRLDHVAPGNPLEIRNQGETLFGGVITGVQVRRVSTSKARGRIKVSVRANDYSFYLNRRLVAKDEYPEQDASDRVKAILYEFAPEFSDPLFIWSPSGTTLDRETIKYETISTVLSRIARAADFVWFIDALKYVHFVPEGQVVAPIPYIDFDDPAVSDPQVEWSVDDLANRIIATDWQKKADHKYRTQYQFDGNTLFYALPMEPFDLEEFEASYSTDGGQTWIPLIVEGDPVGGRAVNFEGRPNRCYVCIFNWGIRLPEVTEVPPGSIIRIEYGYVEPDQAAIFEDPYSIAEFARREGSGGFHEALMALPDVRAPSYDMVRKYAEGILRDRAWPEIRGSFKTDVPGFRPFQRFKVYSREFDLYSMRKKLSSGIKEPVTVWVTDVRGRIAGFYDDDTPRFEWTVSFSNRRKF